MNRKNITITATIWILGTVLQTLTCAAAQDSRMINQNSPRIPTDGASITKGKQIFDEQCGSCHALGYEIIGPALATVQKRRPLPWLINFIHHSQEVIKSGDQYAVTLYKQYGHSVMPSFEFLSNEDILDILAYIGEASKQPVSPPQSATKPLILDDADRSNLPAPSTTSFENDPSDNYYHNRFPTFFKIAMLVISGLTILVLGFLSYTLFHGTKPKHIKGSHADK